MFILLSLLIIVIISLTYILLKKLNLNIAIVGLCTIIIVYFIIFPKQCIASTINGSKMFFLAVFPSLFPFLVICNILISYDGINIYSKLIGKIICKPLRLPLQCSLSIIISFLCGYPLGAKYCCELYANKFISRDTCERLLNIASNAGPIFVIGSLGTVMLNSKNSGYILLISNYVSCIVMSLILTPNNKDLHINNTYNTINSKKHIQNIGNILKDSIDNAIKSVLSIGGYIVIFSVIIGLLESNYIVNLLLSSIINEPTLFSCIKGFLLGLLELTKGCQMIALLHIPFYIKYSMLGFLLGFSGLSIISQVYSFVYIFPEISIKLYIKRKVLQGIICATITPIALNLASTLDIHTVFNSQNEPTPIYLLILLCILLILPLFVNELRKLFHIS